MLAPRCHPIQSMIEQAIRNSVRRAYQYRCGYCGVHEDEAGTLLKIDHFRPRSAGGDSELENLVYCCPTCNRRKGDFWPVAEQVTTQRLWHPHRDHLDEHFFEHLDGRLIALTETSAFYIERLQLNRPPLITLRRTRREVALMRNGLKLAQEEQTRLRQRVETLSQALDEVLEQLAHLSISSLQPGETSGKT